MAKIGAGAVVTGLTVGALAVVTALAVQADGTERDAPPVAASPSGTPSAPGAGNPAPPKAAPAVPAASGAGRRVVYSLSGDRVWLVDPARRPQVLRSYPVQPGAVDPAPGGYTVTTRDPARTGSDGKPIEHVLLFARQSGTVIGFSAAVDGSTPRPAPGARTGGIRETRADGRALWDFALAGSKIVVVS